MGHAATGNKSHQCSIISMGAAPVSWRSGRQTITSMSTAEGELLAGCACFQLYLSVDSVLKELGVQLRGVLGVDNTAAEAIFKNSPANWRTRHLRIRASAVSSSGLEVLHCPGVDMVADVGTKAVREKVLTHVLALMNVKQLTSFQWHTFQPSQQKDTFQPSQQKDTFQPSQRRTLSSLPRRLQE